MDAIASLCRLALDAYTLRQQVIANNIANVDTPGFKRATVKFESYLQHALAGEGMKLRALRNDPRHLEFKDEFKVLPRVIIEHDTTFRADESNIDIHQETVALRSNIVMYNTVLHCVNNKYRLLRLAVQGMR